MSDEKNPSEDKDTSSPTSSRPVGKRQFSGKADGSLAASSVSITPEVVTSRKNPFAAVIDYFRGVFSELAKVIWPTGREMVIYTLVVIAFLVILTALVTGVDFLSTFGLEKLFGVA